MKKQKYILINKVEEILSKIEKGTASGESIGVQKTPISDMRIEDDCLWVSLDGFCKNVLGVDPEFFSTDLMLDSMTKQAKTLGFFPIREFEIDK